VTTFSKAERRAKELLKAQIVGLDTEFRAGGGCQLTDKVSLIQVATETQIVLFHVAQFDGKQTSELIPPSLKRLLESPNIVKTGSGVHGDAARLEKYFDCKVQRAYDLKQFLQIVHPKEKSESATLDIMTRRYYEIGLDKTQSNRCTDWTKPLNEKQKEYAASDAYASLKVFQSIDADRREKRLPSVHQLFAANAKTRPERKRKADDSRPETLYDALHQLRDQLATKHDIIGCTIMTNAIMKEIAKVIPMNVAEVKAIKCSSKYEFHEYAQEIADVVTTHVRRYRIAGKRQFTTQSTLEQWIGSSQEIPSTSSGQIDYSSDDSSPPPPPPCPRKWASQSKSHGRD
jgi:ribonuclease D